jgi:hypothetical protein
VSVPAQAEPQPIGAYMKMLAEYLESAIKFEKMASEEKDASLKAHFEKQATAYRKLAEKRAKEYGLKMPPSNGPLKESA